ncbi:MAG: DNA primase [Thermodesulfobacteria bacterium]|nr:DNA primase [Thermodesulfobacteriota bacterium]
MSLREVARRIKETVNIVDVISEYVALKRSGRNYLGLCPFHADRKPSFVVNEEKQIFRCFGCGVGGDVIGFYMKFHNLDFVEAVRELARRFDIPFDLDEGDRVSASRQKALFEVNEKAQRFFVQMLWASRAGEEARAYLQKRGLSAETAKIFGLGFAPNSYDSLASHLKLAGIDLSLAEEAGLLVRREDGSFYDRFRHRLIFPIYDLSGRVVGFGGRILGSGEPKYLNTPETAIYHKGALLYGLFHTRDFIRSAGFGLVVEGYLDLLSLYEAGIKEVVASLGTALTAQHVRQMKGLSQEWYLVFDADEAGLKAAMRAAPIFLNEGLFPRVIILPQDEDPDSFVRQHGARAFLDLKEKALEIFDFLLEILRTRHPPTPEGKLAVFRELEPALMALKDPVLLDLEVKKIAERLGISETAIKRSLAQRKPHPRPEALHRSSPAYLERVILEFVVHYPRFIKDFEEIGLGEIFQEGVHRRLYEALKTVGEQISVEDLTFDDLELQALLSEILLSPPPFEDVPPERVAAEIKGWWLKKRYQQRLEELLEAIRKAEASGQMEEALRLLREYQELRCQI